MIGERAGKRPTQPEQLQLPRLTHLQPAQAAGQPSENIVKNNTNSSISGKIENKANDSMKHNPQHFSLGKVFKKDFFILL